MKNKLEPWEEGLAGRMKEHEFSFDPAAMAGFESLLAAETTVAGEAAPGETVTPMSSTGGGMFSGKLFGLLLGALVVGGLLFYNLTGENEEQPSVVAEPAQVTTSTADTPITASEVNSAPAIAAPIAPTSATPAPANQTLHPAPAPSSPQTPDLIGGTPPSTAVYTPSMDLPRPMPTTGRAIMPRQSMRGMSIPALSSKQSNIIAPLMARPLPSVSITLESAQMSRDRNALFPEVLDKN